FEIGAAPTVAPPPPVSVVHNVQRPQVVHHYRHAHHARTPLVSHIKQKVVTPVKTACITCCDKVVAALNGLGDIAKQVLRQEVIANYWNAYRTGLQQKQLEQRKIANYWNAYRAGLQQKMLALMVSAAHTSGHTPSHGGHGPAAPTGGGTGPHGGSPHTGPGGTQTPAKPTTGGNNPPPAHQAVATPVPHQPTQQQVAAAGETAGNAVPTALHHHQSIHQQLAAVALWMENMAHRTVGNYISSFAKTGHEAVAKSKSFYATATRFVTQDKAHERGAIGAGALVLAAIALAVERLRRRWRRGANDPNGSGPGKKGNGSAGAVRREPPLPRRDKGGDSAVLPDTSLALLGSFGRATVASPTAASNNPEDPTLRIPARPNGDVGVDLSSSTQSLGASVNSPEALAFNLGQPVEFVGFDEVAPVSRPAASAAAPLVQAKSLPQPVDDASFDWGSDATELADGLMVAEPVAMEQFAEPASGIAAGNVVLFPEKPWEKRNANNYLRAVSTSELNAIVDGAIAESEAHRPHGPGVVLGLVKAVGKTAAIAAPLMVLVS
ncbi:MAG TPA: hypothetical protein VMV79_04270, partial [Alphaproteobacteria bacterium]|nr:hypothetical protein [Alphaproteobacteria bacterium]